MFAYGEVSLPAAADGGGMKAVFAFPGMLRRFARSKAWQKTFALSPAVEPRSGVYCAVHR